MLFAPSPGSCKLSDPSVDSYLAVGRLLVEFGQKAVAIKVLEDLGLLNDKELKKLSHFRVMDNLNDVKKVVGEVRPVFQLS